MKIVDAYAHIFPRAVMEAFHGYASGQELASLKVEQTTYHHDTGARLAFLDRAGIDVQVLVLARPPVWLGLAPEAVEHLVTVANDSIADIAAAHPDRFVGVGVLPLANESAVAELRRIRDRGLKGVLIFSNLDGDPVDSGMMREILSSAAEMHMPVWLHPQNMRGPEWLREYAIDRILGWPFETSVAMVRLVMSGIMRDIPKLQIVTHHLGGMIPYYAERIMEFAEERHQWDERGDGPLYSDVSLVDAARDLRRFYNDTSVQGAPDTLRCGIAHFGVGHVLFGTDFPFGPDGGERWPGLTLSTIRSLDLSPIDRDAILGGNAAALLGL